MPNQRALLAAAIMIRLVQNLLVVAASSLLVIGSIDLSARAVILSLAMGVAAYSMHLRLAAFWWIVCGLLVISFGTSIREFFRAAHAPMLFMCSMLSTLTIVLIASWWWRQRDHFDRRRSLTKG
jgi:hypothetical protein